MGRQYAGPTRVGTHVYALGLAPTNAGKDHPLDCASRILHAAGMGGNVGPGEFISSTAVINILTRMPLSLCCMDEFGAFLGRINSRKAGGFEKAVGGLLRTAWGKSFALMPTPEWAQKRSTPVFAPALSLLGMSTPEEFFAGMSGLDTTNGVLNRFLVFATPTRPPLQTPAHDVGEVPAGISEGLKLIMQAQGGLIPGFLNESTVDVSKTLIRCPWASDGAKAAWDAFAAEIDAQSDREADFGAFFGRAPEYAQRLATIHAVGRVGGPTEVRLESIEWGIAVARAAFGYVYKQGQNYIADTDSQARAQEIVRALKARKGKATRRQLTEALKGRYSIRDFNDSVMMLLEMGRVEATEKPNRRGRATVTYRLV
jgi:hypothetical protein